MKKLFLLCFLPLVSWATTRTVTITAPSSVTAGQSVTVPTSVSTDATDGEQIGFYFLQYSTDGGSSWNYAAADVSVGTSATRNAYITAGSAGSTIQVRVMIAFRGGSAGDVDYAGNAIDWGGTWSSWSTPPCKYASISVVAPPNTVPTVEWAQIPDTTKTEIYVNDWFTVQAKGTDTDGNLSSIWVYQDGSPFAVNVASNGYTSYSDANMATKTTAGTTTFTAKAYDSSGAVSSTLSQALSILNRAPDSLTLTITGTDVGWNSTYLHYTGSNETSVTATAVLHDPDGNLCGHVLRYQKVPTGTTAADDSNWTVLSSNDSPTGAYTSTKAYTILLTDPGRYDFSSYGHDNYVTLTDAVTIWIYGQANGATFVSQSVPSSATTGDTFTATVVMANNGDKAWTYDSTPHGLGSLNAQNNTTWGMSRVYLGSSEVINPSSQKTFTLTCTAPTTPGTYNFQWQMVEDLATSQFFGDTTTNVAITVTDNDSPTTPSGLSSGTVLYNSFTLSWGAATDNLAVTAYEVFKDGVSLGTTTSTSMSVSGLTANTTYAMTVRAKDAAGNWSSLSSALSVTTVSDPNVDDDGDGIPNGIENQLGTNPSVAAQTDSANATQLKIQKPQ